MNHAVFHNHIALAVIVVDDSVIDGDGVVAGSDVDLATLHCRHTVMNALYEGFCKQHVVQHMILCYLQTKCSTSLVFYLNNFCSFLYKFISM